MRTKRSDVQSAIRNAKSAAGFTLVELLVVVGIIVLLIGILLPVVNGVRKSAYAASSANQILRITSAMEAYNGEHRAYPGPLSNDQIIMAGSGPNALPKGLTGEKVTMSENVVLGLIGGLKLTNTGIEYDPQRIASRMGPMSLNPAAPKGGSPYIQVAPAELSKEGANLNSDLSMGGPAADDSIVPEFLDAFPDALPVLIYRARKGAPGVISDKGLFQYDIQQNLGYVKGKSASATTGLGGNGPHGLKELGPATTMDKAQTPEAPWGNGGGVKAYTAWTYFANPQLTPTSPAPTLSTGVPRQKDGYIIISPGKDRVYGTRDDITNFGSLQ